MQQLVVPFATVFVGGQVCGRLRSLVPVDLAIGHALGSGDHVPTSNSSRLRRRWIPCLDLDVGLRETQTIQGPDPLVPTDEASRPDVEDDSAQVTEPLQRLLQRA